MAKKYQVVVVGLGKFGGRVASTLFQSGHDVLGIDIDNEKVQEIQGRITYAVQGDASQRIVLNELGVQDYDAAVVAIGDDLGQNITTTVLLKSMVKEVWSRSHSDLHTDTLLQLECTPISVEEGMGTRVGHNMFKPAVHEYMELSDDFGISQLIVPTQHENMSLENLGLKEARTRHGISIISITRRGEIIISPNLKTSLEKGDILTICGNDDQVEAFIGSKNGKTNQQ